MPGLVETFSRTADGTPFAQALELRQIIRHLREGILKEIGPGSQRIARAKMRLDLYHDRGLPHFEAMLRELFDDPHVREPRKKALRYAKFQNVTKRIVNDIATVYQEPAKRRFPDESPSFMRFSQRVALDSKMRLADRFVGLLNASFAMPRARTENGRKVPVLDVLPTTDFTPIPDPLDGTKMVGVLIDRKPRTVGVKDTDPHYTLWTDTERVWLDRQQDLVPGSWVPNPFGRIPGVLIPQSEAAWGSPLLDEDTGADIIDAHFAVALLNTLMLHGQKEGTKAPYVRGDSAATPKGQTLDHTKITEFSEDQSPGILDLGHDPDSLIRSMRASIGQLAANHGIPEDIFFQTHQANSGFERELKMQGLRERRKERIPLFRRAENELAEIASIVFEAEADPEFRFDATDFEIDFGEIEAPQDPQSRNKWRREARKLGTRSVIDDLLEDNPDLETRDNATARLVRNVQENAIWISLVRTLNIPVDADGEDAGQSPEDNGRMGRPNAADTAERDDGANQSEGLIATPSNGERVNGSPN